MALKYVVDGEVRIVACGVARSTLPVLMRSGKVKWMGWGAPGADHMANPDAPGHFVKFPRDPWVERETVRNLEWGRYHPRPVKIAVAAFAVYFGDLDRWIALKPHQYLQGATASVGSDQRVYVVTVPPPVEYAGVQPCWPRIVSGVGKRLAR